MRRCFSTGMLFCLVACGCRSAQKAERLIGSPPMPPFEPVRSRLFWEAGPGLKPTLVRPGPKPRPVPEISRSLAGETIVVDPGHGGRDPGTLGGGVSSLPEKDIVLMIAEMVARRLRDRGATVVSTRTTDRFIPLGERAATADRRRADLFVSIHADAAANPEARGTTVYIGRGRQPKSRRAAERVRAALVAAGITCRGVRQANFVVLIKHSSPAILIECGYLSNARDAAALNTSAYRSRIAAAITAGIANYFR